MKCRPNFGPPTIRAVTFGVWAAMASACHAGEQSEHRQPGVSSANVPANLTRAVATAQNSSIYPATGRVAQPQYIQIKSADFRLDWPITELTPDDVEFYLRWLTTKTRYKAALPTAKEWEWFARAGNPAARFPSGDDDGVGHEQLYGTPINDADAAKPSKDGCVFRSRRVGTFPPDAWCIHYLMGNVRELTSNVLSGEELASSFPSHQAGSSEYSRVVIKGSDAWSRPGARDGVARELHALISDGRYSTEVGVRVVLIEDDGAK